MDGEHVLEFAVQTEDGDVVVRTSQGENAQYPAAQWARDQLALGAEVRWRKIVILDDWTDLPSGA